MADPTNDSYNNRPVTPVSSSWSGGSIAAIVIAVLVMVGLLFLSMSGDSVVNDAGTAPTESIAPDTTTDTTTDAAALDVAPEGEEAQQPLAPATDADTDADTDAVPPTDVVPPADDTTTP